LGHKVGDKALKIVTQRLSQTLRKGDTLARLGGDEFSVIIEDLKEPQDASLLAEKILRLLAEPMSIDNHVFYSGCSIGISLYPDNGDLPEDLLKYADAAMYNAKNEGRNNFQYYTSEMTERALERVMMETKLREGLKNNEFVVFYQPQVDGRSGSLCGMEALVRWQSPELGLVSPAKFIPIAESTGLIVELDRHVMRTAMTQIARWYAAGFNPGVLAMNLAVKQLHQKDFFDFLEALINETGCKAEWLELEVTEGQIMIHPDEAIKILTRLSAIGVNLAIDDFGTGYSSLSYLKKFPINKLKIDRSFIKDLPEDEEDAAITRAIIALSRNLNLSIIAEGVETTEQHTFLIDNGCAHIQGYFYSKPLPTDEMEVALSRTFG
jgi:predicted signal transduction protein with EAL and GGDEF domain